MIFMRIERTKVNQMNIKKDMKVSELMEEFENCGVLGSGRVARASDLLAAMINEEDMHIFMSMAGPQVPGGMRNIISYMIKHEYINVLVTSGANITHDLLESFGGRHYRDFGDDDEALNKAGIGRIADVYTQNDDFEIFETEINKIFDKLSKKLDNPKDKGIISINTLLHEIGLIIDDENSILHQAAIHNVDIFAPGIVDSMLGLQLWMFTQDHNLILDVVKDMHHFSDLVFESPEIGGIFLGGGVPKHYTMASTLLKGGLDAAIQITMDRPEAGSLSGAPLEEAKSWSKAKCGSNLANVVGDATIIFPLIFAAALDKIE
jgi:deoxyhypusine synthase